MLVVGCGKSFLEIDPVGSLTGDKLFSDVEGYQSSLAGAYSLFAKYHLGQYGLYGEIRSDNILIRENLAASVLEEYNYASAAENALGMGAGIWRSIFETLNNVNNIIEAKDQLLKDFPNQKDLINATYGQALVLRAMCHFDLSNVFSQHYTYTADGSHLGTPILLTTPYPGTAVKRATIKETYQQIVADLTEADKLLAGTSTRSKIYASSEAAKALLSRVYLYMEDWQGVIDQATPLVTSNKYPLTAAKDYLNMFIEPGQRLSFNTIHPEVIWQLNLSTNSSSFLTLLFSDRANFMAYPNKDFMALFESSDWRGIQFQSTEQAGVYYNLKYALPPGSLENEWPVNYKMFRSAELYLNLAEAYFHKQQYQAAAEQIKIVRARAYNTPVKDIEVAFTDPQQLLAQIKLERRKELCFENQRIYDIMRYKENLNRTDCNAATCQLNYPNDKFVLPIPQMETDPNPDMQQNPGY